MPTLNPKSPLNFLPKEIGHRQLMLFDSLRFTLEMLDYNYFQLIHCLSNLSNGLENKIHYKIFNYAWGLIDHAQRFYLLYKNINSSKESIINNLNYIYPFRNAIQHLNKNIDQKIIKNYRPVYGTLKWVVNDFEKNEIYTSILVSGIFNSKKLEFNQHSQTGYPNFINDIKLETDTPNNNDSNEINITKLIEDISLITAKLDDSLIHQFKQNNFEYNDWASLKDILLNMKNSTTPKH